jgi:sodium/bile acid cotransporter 7
VLNALRRPWATLLAVAVTFGLLPLVAWGVSPLLSKQLAAGLLIAAVTPCTMASATVWTRKAGGNDSAATVVTVVTNLVCFLITPAWTYAMLGVAQQMSLQDFGVMVGKLLATVVLPVVAAQLLRLYGPMATWSTRNKLGLSIASQVCILFMVTIGAVHTGEQLSQTTLGADTAVQLATMIGAVLFVHVASFWIGLGLARALGLAWGDQLAVGFAGSQKTLMVGMEMSIDIAASVLPMVTYHIGQLFIDTLLADWLKGRTTEVNPEPVKAALDGDRESELNAS